MSSCIKYKEQDCLLVFHPQLDLLIYFHYTMLGVGVRISCILITDEIFKFFCDIIFNVFDKSEINISLQV